MSLARKATVYLLEQDAGITDTIRGLCDEKSIQLECFGTHTELLTAMKGSRPCCIVAANDAYEGQAIDLLETLDSCEPNVPVIILGHHNDVHTAVAVIKAGAMDYIEKPVIYGRLAENFNQVIKLNGSTPA